MLILSTIAHFHYDFIAVAIKVDKLCLFLKHLFAYVRTLKQYTEIQPFDPVIPFYITNIMTEYKHNQS